MTQPAMSRTIRAMEDELGTALFVRRKDGAKLTEAGKVLSRDARQLVDFAHAALARSSRTGRGEPRLRVTARGCDVGVLQQLVDTYHARHPHAVTAHAALVDPLVQADQLRSGAAEVGLLRTRSTAATWTATFW
jgi:DNA-binding transcriptional LysR family regulator